MRAILVCAGIDGVNIMKYYGTSLESKPTDCGMGSRFVEVNTGDVYLFNETAGDWEFQFSLQE